MGWGNSRADARATTDRVQGIVRVEGTVRQLLRSSRTTSTRRNSLRQLAPRCIRVATYLASLHHQAGFVSKIAVACYRAYKYQSFVHTGASFQTLRSIRSCFRTSDDSKCDPTVLLRGITHCKRSLVHGLQCHDQHTAGGPLLGITHQAPAMQTRADKG